MTEETVDFYYDKEIGMLFGTKPGMIFETTPIFSDLTTIMTVENMTHEYELWYYHYWSLFSGGATTTYRGELRKK